MTWDPLDARKLEAALGFWELGLPQSALDELSELPAAVQSRPEVIHIRLMVLMDENRWTEALVEAETLCRIQPTEADGWIKVGFCLHELKRTQEAKNWLLSGPPSLQKNAVFYYNLACYQCQLGQVDEARLLLAKAVAIDPLYQHSIETDDDLEPLRRKK